MNKKLSMFAGAGLALAMVVMPVFASDAGAVKVSGPKTSASITRDTKSMNVNVYNTYSYRAVFNPGESSFPSSAVPGNPNPVNIVFNGEIGEAVVAKQAAIDFSTIEFTKPGRYIYDLTEFKSTDPVNYPVDPSVFKIAIDVTNAEGGALKATLVEKEVDGAFFSGSKDPGAGGVPEAEELRSYLAVANYMHGDAADLDLCVDYTLDITNLPNGIYGVQTNGSNACKNPTTFTKSGSNNKFKFKLKSGEIMTFGGDGQLLMGKNVTVTQAALEGYTIAPASSKYDITTSEEASKRPFAFNNTFNINPSTGVPYNFLPFVLIAIAGAAGVGFVAYKRKANH